MNFRRCAFVSVMVLIVVAVVVVPRHRAGSVIEILDGKGVAGYMMLDDSLLLTYLANLDLLSLDYLGHGRFGLIDRRRGIVRYCHLFPLISMDLCQMFGKSGRGEYGNTVRVVSRLLGVVDDELTLQRVICAYGRLPKVEFDKSLQFPFFLFPSCRYPMMTLSSNVVNGKTETQSQYWDRGISFRSSDEYIININVYPPQGVNTNMIFRMGRVVIGDESAIDIGCVKHSKNAHFGVVELKNDMFRDVGLAIGASEPSVVFAYIGANKLSRLESTILVLVTDENNYGEELEFKVDIAIDIGDEVNRKICLKGILKVDG